MANRLRITLELGPKGKKVVAVAPDWPGLERGAKTGEDAIEKLRSYTLRYSQVAKLAQMDRVLMPDGGMYEKFDIGYRYHVRNF